MNKKLRLIVTTKCPNNCHLCCNKSLDMQKIPVVDRWDYDEIIITGGEPALFPKRLQYLTKAIRYVTTAMGRNPKLLLYTSNCEYGEWLRLTKWFDGITLTPHTKNDIAYFKKLNNEMLRHWWEFTDYGNKEISLRLYAFPEIKDFLPENLMRWQVKDLEWKSDCPVPEGEDLRRIEEFWDEDIYDKYF